MSAGMRQTPEVSKKSVSCVRSGARERVRERERERESSAANETQYKVVRFTATTQYSLLLHFECNLKFIHFTARDDILGID